jgi:hypothetical protein
MEKESFLAKILAGLVPEGVNVDFTFQPFDNKLVELAWTSPNDKKQNLVQVLMNPREKDRIEIKDNH